MQGAWVLIPGQGTRSHVHAATKSSHATTKTRRSQINKYLLKIINKIKIKNEDTLRELWGNIKQNSICIIGVPERKSEGDRKPT